MAPMSVPLSPSLVFSSAFYRMTTPNFGELPPLQQQLVFLFFLEAAFIWDSLLPKRGRGKDGIVACVQCMTLGNEPRMSLQWIKRAIERANVERESEMGRGSCRPP